MLVLLFSTERPNRNWPVLCHNEKIPKLPSRQLWASVAASLGLLESAMMSPACAANSSQRYLKFAAKEHKDHKVKGRNQICLSRSLRSLAATKNRREIFTRFSKSESKVLSPLGLPAPSKMSGLHGACLRPLPRSNFGILPVAGFLRDEVADAAARIGNIACIARNDVEMELGNRLTGGSPVVEAEIETVRSRRQCLAQMFSAPVDPEH